MGQLTRRIQVEYFAYLRERRGLSSESLVTPATTAAGLFEELSARHGFRVERERVRVAVNDALVPWERPLAEGDRVVFLTPFGGG